MAKPALLVVEDDEKIAHLLKIYLENDNFTVTLAYDGESAWSLFQAHQPDAVLLDLMLPGLDGWEICQRIRAGSNVPILMLTSRGEIDDRVQGLDMGADDYVVKPFSFREVVTRVRVVLRRARQNDTAGPIRIGDLSIDPDKHSVELAGNLINLTATEFKILELLAAEPDRVFSRQKIVEHVLGSTAPGYERALDSHMKNLRKKIEPDPNHPLYLITVYGVGYKISGGTAHA